MHVRLLARYIAKKNIRNERRSIVRARYFPFTERELENILFPRMDTRRVIIKRAAVSIYPTRARLFL